MGERFDREGLFWEDAVRKRVKGETVERPMPSIPETGWRAPTTFPNLTAAKCIAVDVETYDPELDDYGPGWARGRGHIVGVSLAVEGKSWYFPMRHETCPEQNMDPDTVLRYLRQALANPNQPKVGANLMYDIGWLKQEGVHVAGELVDVQFAEALIKTNAFVALEVLGQKYLKTGKESNILYEWLGEWFTDVTGHKLRKYIYRAPPSLVGAYAESDAELPLLIAKKQYPILVQEEMLELFRMECELINLLVAMRFQGVTVDIPKAEKLREDLITSEGVAQKRLDDIAGKHVDVNTKGDLVPALQKAGVHVPLTKKGNPSLTKSYLDNLTHPFGDAINAVRKVQKIRGTFVEGYVLGSNVNGKVYGQFHPLKGESGGTGYGRFSSSSPNLQNIPSRDKFWAKIVRGIFIPDDGHDYWRKDDYSQIEYRILGDSAVGAHAHIIQNAYISDPRTDFHKNTGDQIERVTGKVLEHRTLIKNINFGMAYGMGKPKLKATLGLPDDDAEALFAAYHAANPYVKATFDHYASLAQNFGHITTVLGRKARFDLWEPAGWGNKYDEDGNLFKALPYHIALKEYGSKIERGSTHKALNNRLQGSSADQIKAAMVKCWKDGVFDVTGVPRLQVHDELDYSVVASKASDEAFREAVHIMETCVPLKVPVIVDTEIGTDWGNVKECLGSFTSIGNRT